MPFGDAATIPKPSWREAAAFLEQNMRPGDLAVVHLRAAQRLYDYYVHRPDVPRRGVDSPSLPVSLPLDGRRLWLVLYNAPNPANPFLAKAPLRIERRYRNEGLFILELTDEPAVMHKED